MRGAKKIYWTAQIIGWTSYAFLSFFASYVNKEGGFTLTFLVMALLFASSGLMLTHFMRGFMLRYKLLDLPFFKASPILLIFIIACAFVLVNMEFFIRWAFNDHSITALKQQFGAASFYMSWLGAFLLLILWNGIYFTYYFFNKSYFQTMDNLRLQSVQQEIELKNLKSQLNPHFLFNALNSIRALIEIEPTLAKKSITELSNLLRSSLMSGKKDTISIGEELMIVENYLNLEKIRFENRLNINYEIDNTLKDLEIPPFIIQTLAENAIKHGISKIMNGGMINIEVRKESSNLVIRVSNSGTLTNSKPDTGIGLENIVRRLDLMYKHNALFKIQEINNLVVSEIIIKNSL
jgi:hypothetical protein